MTHDHSTAPLTADWIAALAQAFGEVLGRPLDAYDAGARYGAFYSGNFLAESELDRDRAWVGRAALAGEATLTFEYLLLTPPGDLDHPSPVFDASRSLYLVDPAAFPAGLAADLSELADGCVVPGAELGRLAERHGVDLAAPDLPATAWTLWQARIASADTLLDALRAATGLLGATSADEVPAGLGASADEVDDEAHERVAAVTDPGLRDYLAAFCDPESHDLALCLYDRDDPNLVVQWEGAVDQYEVVVRRLDGLDG
ncbi:hypothetical protein [Kitasatospora sp. NPDC093806]|uniref:hypothetical protein n=1 Tax=Kitasatospora sp. NPDC093806 TaxID=3155075 RepID=UPI0034196906